MRFDERDLIHFFVVISLIITTIYFIALPLYVCLIYIAFSLIVFHLGHGVFIHRHFSHGHFSFNNKITILGHLLFIMTNMGRAIAWAGMHINHHKHSGTSQDPHEWRRVGLLNALFSNFGDAFFANKKYMRSIYRRKYLPFFTKYHYYILTAYLPIFSPVILMSFFWKQFTIIAVHSGSESKKRYEKNSDTSSNNTWLSWLMWGDERHLDHHLGKRRNDLLNKIGNFMEKL